MDKRAAYNRYASRGLTLVEVLLALVILTIGVFAVLRIFPAGFSTVENTRQRIVATSLANAELERWKMLANNMYTLPEAIVATDRAGNLITDYLPTSMVPIEADRLAPGSPGSAVPCWEPDSLWLPRTILGERAIIPPAVGGAATSFCLLALAPLANLTTTQTLQVCDPAPFQRVTGTPTGRQYQPDYSVASGTIAFDAAYTGSNFSVTYSWVGDDGLVRTVIAEPMSPTNVVGATVTADVQAKTDSHFQRLLEYSERVYLAYQDVSPNAPAATGQFAHYVSTLDPFDGSFRATGLVYFYPGDAGHEVRVNYRVADWTILHEDRDVPANRTVRLGLAPLKGPTYRNPPRQPRVQPLPDNANFIVAVNLADGTVYSHPSLQLYWHSLLTVNYRNGEIQFPDIPGIIGSTVRIYYRAQGDWGVQVQKAAATYAAAYGLVGDPDQFEGFSWAGGKALQFAVCEFGKTVSLSYYRDIDMSRPSNGIFTDPEDIQHQYVTSELATIKIDGTADFCPDLPDPANPTDPFLAQTTPNTSITVKGASFTARAIWIGTGKSMVPKARTLAGNRNEYLNESWHHVRQTTFLTTPLR